MIQAPIISVIVPVYNVENFLEQCVDSILSQTYSNLQIILVNDGSTDSSGRICDDFAIKDKRVCVIHKTNGGLSSARNSGLDIAIGDYIGFVDSDDFIAPSMYEQMLEVSVDQEVDFVGCAIERYYYRDDIYKPYLHYHYTKLLTNFTSAELLRLHILCQIDCSACNKLYKKELFVSNRFKVGVTNEDFLFFYYFYKKVGRLTYLNRPLYFYRYTENSISNSINIKSFDIIDNALEIKEDILKYNAEDLKAIIDRYLYAMCFSYCLIIRYKCNSYKFGDRYKQLFSLLSRNLHDIFTNQYFSFARKLMIVTFVRYTFLFDFLYRLVVFVKKFLPTTKTNKDQNNI